MDGGGGGGDGGGLTLEWGGDVVTAPVWCGVNRCPLARNSRSPSPCPSAQPLSPPLAPRPPRSTVHHFRN